MRKLSIFLLLVLVMSVGAYAVRSEQDCANQRSTVNNIIANLAASGNSQKMTLAENILQYTSKCCRGELSPSEQQECADFYSDNMNLAFMQNIIGQDASDEINYYALNYCSGYTWGEGDPTYNCGCPDCDALGEDAEAIASFMGSSTNPSIRTLGRTVNNYVLACCEDETCSGCTDTMREQMSAAVIELLSQTNAGTANIGGQFMTPPQAARKLMEYMQCCCECKKVTGMAAGVDGTPVTGDGTGAAIPYGGSYGQEFCEWFDSSPNILNGYIGGLIGNDYFDDVGGAAVNDVVQDCKDGTLTNNHLTRTVRTMLEVVMNEGDVSTDMDASAAMHILRYLDLCCASGPTMPYEPPVDTVPIDVLRPQQAVDDSTLMPHQRAAQTCRDMMARLAGISGDTSSYDQIMLQQLMDCIQRCCDEYAARVEAAYDEGDATPIGADMMPAPTDTMPYPGGMEYPGYTEPQVGLPADDGAIMWDPDLGRMVPVQADMAGDQVMMLRSEVPSAGKAFGLGETSTVSNIIWVGLAIVAIILLFLVFKGKKK